MRIWTSALLTALVLAALPARAQTTSPGFKDPGTAMIISVLVPGGGQVYSGETKRGLTIFGAGVGSLILGSALAVDEASDCAYEGDCASAGGSTAPLMLGYLGYLAAWGYGVYDAQDSAKRMNQQNGFNVAGFTVEPLAAPSREGTRLGLQVRF